MKSYAYRALVPTSVSRTSRLAAAVAVSCRAVSWSSQMSNTDLNVDDNHQSCDPPPSYEDVCSGKTTTEPDATTATSGIPKNEETRNESKEEHVVTHITVLIEDNENVEHVRRDGDDVVTYIPKITRTVHRTMHFDNGHDTEHAEYEASVRELNGLTAQREELRKRNRARQEMEQKVSLN